MMQQTRCPSPEFSGEVNGGGEAEAEKIWSVTSTSLLLWNNTTRNRLLKARSDNRDLKILWDGDGAGLTKVLRNVGSVMTFVRRPNKPLQQPHTSYYESFFFVRDAKNPCHLLKISLQNRSFSKYLLDDLIAASSILVSVQWQNDGVLITQRLRLLYAWAHRLNGTSFCSRRKTWKEPFAVFWTAIAKGQGLGDDNKGRVLLRLFEIVIIIICMTTNHVYFISSFECCVSRAESLKSLK